MTERSKQNYQIYYDIMEEIGEGVYGSVYKGIEKKTQELRALKVMNYNKIKKILSYQYEASDIEKQLELLIKEFIKEFDNMKICSYYNNNSVKCYEYFNNKNNFIIIMELCDTNLSKMLINKLINGKHGFYPIEILEIMNQLNNSFKIMNEKKIIHQNLKLENILIKYDNKKQSKYTIKLSDYGCNRGILSLLKNNYYKNMGTIAYMAPEILKGDKYNYESDLWSIGIIIYRLIFGKLPFIGEGNILFNKNEKLGNNLLKKTGNVDLDDLIQKLLEKDPEKRINWHIYFYHPFFKSRFRNKINLVYLGIGSDSPDNIFGEKFVDNNKNNLELVINGNPIELTSKFSLKIGLNNIQLIIKKKLTNLEYMFYQCCQIKNIEELEYLDIREVNDFSYMFTECSYLSDIKSLENWNVSNGDNFSNMFDGCYSLSDIGPLEKWNVSNGKDFSYMFRGCAHLSDIKPLEKWNPSNGENFSYMFDGCSSLSDIKPLEKWNVPNGKDFSYMFSMCSPFIDINLLQIWIDRNRNNLPNVNFY